MNSKWVYKFAFKHDIAWSWDIGAFFCVSPKDIRLNREIYLFFCIGKHDFSIGMLNCEVVE